MFVFDRNKSASNEAKHGIEKNKKMIDAEEFDKIFDEGKEDILQYFDKVIDEKKKLEIELKKNLAG